MTDLDTLDVTALFNQTLLQQNHVPVSALPHTLLNVLKL